MTYDLEDCIKDSYDDTMKTYLKSPEYEKEGWDINQMYYELRNILELPEDKNMLDTLINALEEKSLATSKEAYYRGVVLGMSHSKHLLKDIEKDA
nr:MAG TPA: hypothetical protein [Caudoviricetes sp.]